MGVVYEAEQISLRRRVALEGPAVRRRHRPAPPPALQERGAGRRARAAREHRPGTRGRLRARRPLLRDAVHRRAEPRRADRRAPSRSATKRSRPCRLQCRTPAAPRNPPRRAETRAAPRPCSPRRPLAGAVLGPPRYFDRVAGLGRQAALALEHAHQVGVVHRDVKPGNLLLDLRGQLWVTDFGLAQVAGDAGLTITGELLGTLRYASPEQTPGPPGDRRPPQRRLFAGRDALRAADAAPALRGPRPQRTASGRSPTTIPVRRARSTPPSRAELETIVLKALRKEPADRYATAQELADDLQRFLDGRPILARRPTPAERLRTWSRRHPSIVAAAVVALVLLSAASLVSTALVRREQEKTLAEQQKAESAYHRERQRAEEAEARFRLARRAVDELIQVSEEELAHRPGMEGLRKRLLASALAYYQEFIEQRRERPRRAGRAARHDAAGRDDPRRPGGAARRGRAVPAGPAGRARRPAARRRPAGQGDRALRPRRQTLAGVVRRPRPAVPPPSASGSPSSRPAPTRRRSTRS